MYGDGPMAGLGLLNSNFSGLDIHQLKSLRKSLFTLYNLLENPYSRFYVYMKILDLAASGKVNEQVVPSTKKIDTYLKEWNLEVHNKREFFLSITNVLKDTKRYGGTITNQIKRLSASCDWTREHFTLDEQLSPLEHVLTKIPGTKRMIMGHTIQESGINGACNNQPIRIDMGLSKGCGNRLPKVLEINRNSGLRILTSNPLNHDKSKSYLEADRKEGSGVLLPVKGPNQVEVKA